MTLSSCEFIRRFLMHTLPSGFVRIRYFGFLANRYRRERLELCRSLLQSAGRDFEIVQYPDAGHAFFNDSRPEMYRPEAAREAWPRAVGYLKERLAG